MNNKSKYNFNTLVPSILGDNYTNMELIATFTYETAINFGDIVTVHNDVLTEIPNLPANPADLNYLYFKDVNGNKTLFAKEWLDEASITEVGSIGITVELVNMTTADITRIRNKFIELGYGTNIKDIKAN